MDKEEKVKLSKLREGVDALVRFVRKKSEAENSLFDSTEFVVLHFVLEKIPSKPKHKPVLIPLSTPLYTDRSVCIVVKDPQRKYKDLFEKHPFHPEYKVVGVDKIKKKYRQFEQRRELCDAHDLFLCDSRIMDMMPNIMGKYFFVTKKKLPIPVKVVEKSDDIAEPLKAAIASTTLRTPGGPSCGVKIGRCDMSTEEILENAKKVLPVVFKHFAAEGNAVKKVLVQAQDAPALPLWTAAPPAGLKRTREESAAEQEEATPAKPRDKSLAELSRANKKRKA